MDAYAETGRDRLRPIPVPLPVEVERFNIQAGHVEDGKPRRSGKAIRDQIKKALDENNEYHISDKVKTAIKSFSSPKEREAYAEAALLFEPQDKKRKREDDGYIDTTEPDEGDSDLVKRLKRQLAEQQRKIEELSRGKESAGLGLYRHLVTWGEKQKLEKSILMCACLMFWEKHERFAVPETTVPLFRIQDIEPAVGAFKRDPADGTGKAVALLRQKDPGFLDRCKTVGRSSGAAFIKIPLRDFSAAQNCILGPEQIRHCLSMTRPLEFKMGTWGSHTIDVDISHVAIASSAASAALSALAHDPDLSGNVMSASFNFARLEDVGWTTVIPQALVACQHIPSHKPDRV